MFYKRNITMGYLSMLLIITTVRFASATQFDSFNSTWTDGSPSSETSPLERISNVTLTVLRRCLDSSEAAGCLRQKIMKALDYAIRDNGTWRINDYVTFERNPEYEAEERMIAADTMGRADDPVDNTVSGKLSKLLRSRRVQMYTNLVPTVNEGRKKKHKQGGGMFFGGIAMAALYAQVVLGKVTLLAGAAFMLAKIALIVATATSLKKHAASSGGTTEHIIYADGGGHGGGHEGYRRNTFRSMMGTGEYATPPPYSYEASDELKDRDIRFV